MNPHKRCKLCKYGHNRKKSIFCGAPCTPLLAAAIDLIKKAPRGYMELIRELACLDKPFKADKRKLKSDMKKLIARKIIYRTSAGSKNSPVVLHVHPDNDDATKRAAKLQDVQNKRIAQNNRDNPRRKKINSFQKAPFSSEDPTPSV